MPTADALRKCEGGSTNSRQKTMVYRFHINCICHHDFGGRLDELYSTASGRRAADRMEYVIDHMGSLEVRHRLVEWVREMARSEKMKCIRETYGYCTLFR